MLRNNNDDYDIQYTLCLQQRSLSTNGVFKNVDLRKVCHSDVSRAYDLALQKITDLHYLDNADEANKLSGQFFVQDDSNTKGVLEYMRKFNTIQNIFIRHFADAGFQMVYHEAGVAEFNTLASVGGIFPIQSYPARAVAASRN